MKLDLVSPTVGANFRGLSLDLRVGVRTNVRTLNARDTRVYTGLGLYEDKNPTSCVHWLYYDSLD
jgi:hypothetical protein